MTDVNVTYSERGFPQFDDEVVTDYGHTVRIYGSSAAMKDAVWMSVKKEDGPYIGSCDVAVHMDLAQATAVRNRLSAWIDMINGYVDTDVEQLRAEIVELQGQLTRIADDLAPWRTREDE